MKARILALCVFLLLVVVAILVLAWIMGEPQPTRWIETPIAAPGAKVVA